MTPLLLIAGAEPPDVGCVPFGTISVPFGTPRPRPCARRPRVRPETWASIAAAISRQHSILAETEPTSPRIRPSLQRIAWLDRKPGMEAA
jgi:hypothetical protein